MKLFVLGAVLCSILVVAFGAENRTSVQEPVLSKEEEAIKYCNSSYPVTEDTRQKAAKYVINAQTIPNPSQFNNIEWCNLYCVLEKVGFFDAEGRMQVHRIFKYVLKFFPEIAPYSHTLLIHLHQISRSIKGMEDKCYKAFATYFRFTEAIMVVNIAADVNANPDVREKIIEAILSEDTLPKELEANVEKYFKNVDLFFKKTVESSPNINSTAAPIPVA